MAKQYEDISQLLLYSFGLQNQEFVVVYETDDLARFSDLVNELRDTGGADLPCVIRRSIPPFITPPRRH